MIQKETGSISTVFLNKIREDRRKNRGKHMGRRAGKVGLLRRHAPRIPSVEVFALLVFRFPSHQLSNLAGLIPRFLLAHRIGARRVLFPLTLPPKPKPSRYGNFSAHSTFADAKRIARRANCNAGYPKATGGSTSARA